MRWTERQRAMLREMGVQLWPRGGAADLAEAPAVAVVEAPAASRVAASPSVDTAAGTGNAALPASGAAADWRPAECLVVGDPAEAGPGGGDDADRLLLRMLHAALLAPDAPGPAGRACRLALPADLDAAIAAVRPRAILALGRAAAQALLGSDEPVGRLRGRLHARAGVPVVVSFAPAYLLRHPEEKAKAWADLCLLAGALSPSS